MTQTKPPPGAVRPPASRTLPTRIASLAVLDRLAEPLQGAVRRVLPTGTAAKDVLSGTWLGHPVHPPLTDVVVGAWTSGFLLDLLGEEGADALVALGALAAAPTAASGLSDFAELRGESRRIGAAHALGNTTALALQLASLRARRRGARRTGVAWSALALSVATLSAWLGGHLSFGRGVGVDQTVFESAPDDWTAVLAESELEDGKPAAARAGTLDLVLVRAGDRIHALAARCSHRGCSLVEGELNADGTLTCPCHGSTYRLDGALVRGPATAPQPAYAVRVRDGAVEIRAAG